MSNCFDIHHLDLPKVFAPQKPLLISQYFAAFKAQESVENPLWQNLHLKISTSTCTSLGRELAIKIIKDKALKWLKD